MKTILLISWLVNILVFPKHNFHNLFIKFYHTISAHGYWSTTGHAPVLSAMLTMGNKSLNFHLISFDSRVSYHYNIPFLDYARIASDLAFVEMLIYSCWFELESSGDRLPDTWGYINDNHCHAYLMFCELAFNEFVFYELTWHHTRRWIPIIPKITTTLSS